MTKPQEKDLWWVPKNGVFKTAQDLLAGKIGPSPSKQAEPLTGLQKYLQDQNGHANWKDYRAGAVTPTWDSESPIGRDSDKEPVAGVTRFRSATGRLTPLR